MLSQRNSAEGVEIGDVAVDHVQTGHLLIANHKVEPILSSRQVGRKALPFAESLDSV